MSRDLALFTAFDLLVNAVGSFAIGALVAWAAVRAFRVGRGRWAQVIWAIPFLKVIADAARGIPEGAYFWARTEGVTQQLGHFQAGVGFRYVVPQIHFALTALTARGKLPSTVADLAATALGRGVAPGAPAAIAAVILAIAAARITLRIARVLAGERARARLAAEARLLEVRRVGRLHVSVFVSAGHRGAPFTGGFFRPYVCFPEATFAALSPGERAAAIGHELAHLAHRDLWLLTALDLLGDLLWFVPGSRAVRRRIEASCEHLADAAAVRAGASPVELASALVRVHEAFLGQTPAPAIPLLRPRSELGRRVGALLGRDQPGPRWGFQRPWARLLLGGWVAAVALISTFGGH